MYLHFEIFGPADKERHRDLVCQITRVPRIIVLIYRESERYSVAVCVPQLTQNKNNT